MTDKEQIMIDGVDVSKCEHWNICKQCELSQLPQSNYELLCKDNPHCYFKQLARKTQECEELKKKIETYKCSTNCHKYIEADRYRKALEEIAGIAKDGLNPICYKSNCSRCQCYDGDDCNARMNALINNYFTENGEFFDGNGDFAEAIEALLDEERSSCNRAKPISQQILDIIADLRTDETKCNPDSEQIEHTAAKTQMRNSGSVEQIQDSKAKGEGNNAG